MSRLNPTVGRFSGVPHMAGFECPPRPVHLAAHLHVSAVEVVFLFEVPRDVVELEIGFRRHNGRPAWTKDSSYSITLTPQQILLVTLSATWADDERSRAASGVESEATGAVAWRLTKSACSCAAPPSYS